MAAIERRLATPAGESEDPPMPTYDLYLESGPRRRTTMVHVPELLGCVAVGPTTEDALAATPAAIRAFRRFLGRHGEAIDQDAPIGTRVVAHVTEGKMLGMGSPYVLFAPDLLPSTDEDIETVLRRLGGLREEFAVWATSQTVAHLDIPPRGGGRPAWEVLLHVLGATGPTLSAALGSAPGFAATHSAVVRGELPMDDALRRTARMAGARIRAATPDQRTTGRELPGGHRTLRQALRHLLEHDWDHLIELSRRPGGPIL